MSKAIKPIKINLGGMVFDVKFTMGSMIRFEEATGKNALDGASFANMTARDAVAFLWACIATNPHAPSMAELAEMIAPDMLTEITDTVYASMGQAMPELKEDDDQGNADNLSHG